MTAKTKSRILEAIHESASDLHRLGCIDKRKSQEDDLPYLETPALLKILALGEEDVESGRVKPVTDVVARLREKRADA